MWNLEKIIRRPLMVLEDLGKVSVQLQSSSKYYEAVSEGISLLLNTYGMAGLDYLSLSAWTIVGCESSNYSRRTPSATCS